MHAIEVCPGQASAVIITVSPTLIVDFAIPIRPVFRRIPLTYTWALDCHVVDATIYPLIVDIHVFDPPTGELIIDR